MLDLIFAIVVAQNVPQSLPTVAPYAEAMLQAEHKYCPSAETASADYDANSIEDETRIANLLVDCSRDQRGITRARLDALAANFLLGVLDNHPDSALAEKDRSRTHLLIREALSLAKSDKALTQGLREQEESLP